MNYLAKFQPFVTKEEINEAVSSRFERCHRELNETDRAILVMLSHYAVKFPGVALLKSSTIEQALTIMFQATKRKNIRNLFGYYDGVLRRLIDKALLMIFSWSLLCR